MSRSAPADAAHQPVMLREMLHFLAPAAGELHVDGTFGAGGYSRAILEAADCRLIALDRDATVRPTTEAMRRDYGQRFDFIPGRFGDMEALLAAHGVREVQGIVLDIGVSSMQIDRAERGFSFREDGPLDMRMSQEGLSAADVVNGYSEAELADILFIYGEEKASRRIARAIVEARQAQRIERTGELARLVHAAVRPSRHEAKDPATRTFQALRIYVNEELKELEAALHAAERLLSPGGRLVVVVFHSLEDRIVKRFFTERCHTHAGASRHDPSALLANTEVKQPPFQLLTRKAVLPADAETERNPRARSAKLRAALRTGIQPTFSREAA